MITFLEHLSSPLLCTCISGVLAVYCQLHIFPCLVLCCDVRYDFSIINIFGSSLTLVLSGEEEFQDTKGAIRIVYRRTNNANRVTRTSLNTGG
jgi:hypothetical protein